MKTPQIVSPPEWDAARQTLLVKEKELTRARDALAAERRRMPWLAVEKNYRFDGPRGTASLLELFEGRRQLIVYRAVLEPGVSGWPEHACRGCSLIADQVADVAHLNARATTLAFASHAPQPDIERVKAGTTSTATPDRPSGGATWTPTTSTPPTPDHGPPSLDGRRRGLRTTAAWQERWDIRPCCHPPGPAG
jgi:Bacterial protein of unknown function (DUF899)